MEETRRDSTALTGSTLTSSLSSTTSEELLRLTDLAAEEEEFASVSLERQSIQLTTSKDNLLKTVGHDDDAKLLSSTSRKSTTNWSLYGCPVSPEKAAILMPPGSTGLLCHANIVADDYVKHGNLQGLYSRDLDPLTQAIKPRRGKFQSDAFIIICSPLLEPLKLIHLTLNFSFLHAPIKSHSPHHSFGLFLFLGED
jgi:hypothetical protein